MADTLKITVDDDPVESVIVRGALPLPALAEVSARVVELGADVVADAVGATLSTLYEVLSNLPPPPADHELAEIRFKLMVDSKGEVSILSALKGSITGQSGIELSIKRKV